MLKIPGVTISATTRAMIPNGARRSSCRGRKTKRASSAIAGTTAPDLRWVISAPAMIRHAATHHRMRRRRVGAIAARTTAKGSDMPRIEVTESAWRVGPVIVGRGVVLGFGLISVGACSTLATGESTAAEVS